jgi:peptidyl-prolyl cis-trans isomerase SurA
LINIRYGSKVIITDEEIDEVMAEMKKNEGQPEYQVAEIFLPVENQEKESETVAQINRLLQQARAGSNFQALARNFSKNPSAENGGNLGWNRLGQLGAEYDNALVRLKPGQISPPFRTADGYAILFLVKQRTGKALGGADADSAIVNLQQLFLPIPKGSSPAVVNDAMEGAKNFGDKAKNCSDLDKVGKEIGSALSGNLGDIKTSALAAQQRSMIRGLPPLKASRPLRTPDGVIVLMVCRREEAKSPELAVEDLRESIAGRLRNERLSILARQYLRDIRRTAFVEIRL